MILPNSLLILAQALLSCSTACRSCWDALDGPRSGLGEGVVAVVFIKQFFRFVYYAENRHIAYNCIRLGHKKVSVSEELNSSALVDATAPFSRPKPRLPTYVCRSIILGKRRLMQGQW